ncbi:YckD family protein [Sediminibacillus albus]|uniref:DUF2680 domain-containing protein n=1 Tax=Sediminibacillus albus TaxID=407036 RepID=A0A1G8ZXZ7_9BACI|nr:YckD family protein [Sediminibacillus albus]SDK19504.1 Protein of unknown function [Sediminibacillus albus]
MKRFLKSWLALGLALTVSLLGAVEIQAEEDTGTQKKVELTEGQQKELAILYQDLLDKRKGIINKYLEFGVISAEKAEKMTEHLDGYYKKLEANGFIIDWEKHKGKRDKKFPH